MIDLQRMLDDRHEIINDAEIKGGGILHRFKNAAGVPYSAIYIKDEEVFSCEREHEASMIATWNENYQHYTD